MIFFMWKMGGLGWVVEVGRLDGCVFDVGRVFVEILDLSFSFV